MDLVDEWEAEKDPFSGKSMEKEKGMLPRGGGEGFFQFPCSLKWPNANEKVGVGCRCRAICL
jgi:hypothetical protein